jgi:hypothetical protein
MNAMQNSMGSRTVSRNQGVCLPNADIHGLILDLLQRRHEYDLEELVRLCPSFTWNQVFLEVDRLSRTGEVRLLPRRAGAYAVTLPPPSAARKSRG